MLVKFTPVGFGVVIPVPVAEVTGVPAEI